MPYILRVTCRAGLTIWWALRTPQRRGPTGKLDAEEGEGWKGCPSPQPRALERCIYKLLSGVRGGGGAPAKENGFGEI